jgi:hypothetical protein
VEIAETSGARETDAKPKGGVKVSLAESKTQDGSVDLSMVAKALL